MMTELKPLKEWVKEFNKKAVDPRLMMEYQIRLAEAVALSEIYANFREIQERRQGG